MSAILHNYNVTVTLPISSDISDTNELISFVILYGGSFNGSPDSVIVWFVLIIAQDHCVHQEERVPLIALAKL